VIIDIEEFIKTERPIWEEMEAGLKKMETDAAYRMNLAQVRRFHIFISASRETWRRSSRLRPNRTREPTWNRWSHGPTEKFTRRAAARTAFAPRIGFFTRFPKLSGAISMHFISRWRLR